jgi:hypothetical protein
MDEWRPADVAAVVRLLRGAPFAWWLAGGCALDVHVGGPIRARKDVDVAILRRDQARLRAWLRGWDFAVAVEGELVPLRADEWLEPPLHEIWARPESGGPWFCEFLLNEAAGWEWLYRRDRRVRLPLAALMVAAEVPLPALPMEVVLLYKSSSPRVEDETDFAAAVPHLGPAAAEWLVRALRIVDPGHHWIEPLSTRVGPGAGRASPRARA